MAPTNMAGRPPFCYNSLMNLLQQINIYTKRYERFDGATLKMIAMLTMLVDHAADCFLWRIHGKLGLSLALEDARLWPLYVTLRVIGRTAFPIFAFFIAEGYVHTRSRKRYLTRLLLLAVISQIPYDLVFNPALDGARNVNLLAATYHGIQVNTVFTLAAGLALTALLDSILHGKHKAALQHRADAGRQRPLRRELLLRGAAATMAAGAFCLLAEVLHFDYGAAGVLIIPVFYFLRNLRILAIIAGWILLLPVSSLELYSVGGFLLIQCYNGKRGKQIQSLFYIFYPAHLCLLLLLRFMIAGY
jgi:hypothetical protein